MRKIIAIILMITTVFACLSPVSAYADSYGDNMDEITDSVDGILSEHSLDITLEEAEKLSIGDIGGRILDSLTDRLSAPVNLLALIFTVIVLSSVINSLGSGKKASGDVYSMVCVIAGAAVLLPRIMGIYGEILSMIRSTGSFILVFVPVFTAAAFAGGSINSAGMYHMMIVGASEFIVKLSESWFMPVLGVSAALGITGSVFPDSSLESLVELLKKAVTWGISISMTLFVGFVSLKCTISASTDGAAAKTTKMLVNGFVPIVGGAVSDALSSVKGSFQVIGGAVGTAGIIGIVLLILPVILEVLVYRLVMWLGMTAAELFSAVSVRKLLKSIDSGLAIAQCILVCYSVMFVICSAILIRAMG